MFDKVTIKGTINIEDTETIVLKNYLEECSEGDEVFYRSTQYSNIEGIWVELRGNTIKAKFSVNKQFYKRRKGRLENSMPITMAHATQTIREILFKLCVRPEDCVVVYYEIGLTMKMAREPEQYIRKVEEGAGRTMWGDPNYPEMRQKVTEKSKYYRKILKMYDKTYEATEKGRKDVIENVLRIETVYKRQSVMMTDMLDPEWQKMVGRRFYDDWSNVRFHRKLRAKKGVRMSQWDKAQDIYEKGTKRYLDENRARYQAGDITKKQWETMRQYANRWKDEKGNYEEIISDEEAEYQNKLLRFYQVGSFVCCK